VREQLAWAGEVAGRPVRLVRELLGGTHATTLLITDGERELVLRQYPDADDAPMREAAVLRALDGLGGWAPRLLGVDAVRGRTLLTRLPGTADIMPADPLRAATELARGLARIHATPAPALREWGREDGRVLTHLDYWSGNVLWLGPRLTGIVDWSGACLAPRGLDVSWCRLDLVLLHGPAVADVFLEAYERAAGTTVPEIGRWDRHALDNARDRIEGWEPNYVSLGRTDLTGAELRARHTRWTEAQP
jgi:aminoglycoside phosphotransferase (APT) family kinase protein